MEAGTNILVNTIILGTIVLIGVAGDLSTRCISPTHKPLTLLLLELLARRIRTGPQPRSEPTPQPSTLPHTNAAVSQHRVAITSGLKPPTVMISQKLVNKVLSSIARPPTALWPSSQYVPSRYVGPLQL